MNIKSKLKSLMLKLGQILISSIFLALKKHLKIKDIVLNKKDVILIKNIIREPIKVFETKTDFISPKEPKGFRSSYQKQYAGVRYT